MGRIARFPGSPYHGIRSERAACPGALPMPYIAEQAWFAPPARITNGELAERVETSDAWIVEHTGIRERRRAPDDWGASDLGAEATRRALERAAWEARSLDLLVCATQTPDLLLPSTACLIGSALNADPVAFDVNAACSGFLYGLMVVEALLKSGSHRRAALVVAEKVTGITDYADRTTCIFFGDGASTALMTRDRPPAGFEVVDLLLHNEHSGARLVTTPVGGTFRQDGAAVKRFAATQMVSTARQMLDRHGLSAGDLRAFCAHQANLRIIELVADELGLAPEQHWHNVEDFGNQGAAGLSSALARGVERHADSLADGDLILLSAVGAGMTSGSALLRRISG